MTIVDSELYDSLTKLVEGIPFPTSNDGKTHTWSYPGLLIEVNIFSNGISWFAKDRVSENIETGDSITVELAKWLKRLVKYNRCADDWWKWHDADTDRWSTTLKEAEKRCQLWVIGETEDGPRL